MRLWCALLPLLIACGLGPQGLVSNCVNDPNLCPPCSTNSECVIVSNPCHESAACAHRDANVYVTLEGCNWQYDPPEESCSCVEMICRAR